MLAGEADRQNVGCRNGVVPIDRAEPSSPKPCGKSDGLEILPWDEERGGDLEAPSLPPSAVTSSSGVQAFLASMMSIMSSWIDFARCCLALAAKITSRATA